MPDLDSLSLNQQVALRSAAKTLHAEFDDFFSTETIELFLGTSYDQFADRATVHNFLPLMAEGFARQRLRATAQRLPWPSSLEGMRYLDIGTMDGFWAFELERRGAGEVVASDVLDATQLDHFAADCQRGERYRRDSERNFGLAAELLGSAIELRDLNVYELDLADVGQFDLVVMGYVLQMLRDPLRGLEAVRRVCRGHLILLETVSRPLELLPGPPARLDARRDGSEWFVFNRRGLCKALDLAGWVVEESTPLLPDRPGPGIGSGELTMRRRAMLKLGFRGRSAAIRARPLASLPLKPIAP